MAEPSPLLVQLPQVVSPPDRAESNFGATPSVCRLLLFNMRVADGLRTYAPEAARCLARVFTKPFWLLDDLMADMQG
jgi:hypothetical protein